MLDHIKHCWPQVELNIYAYVGGNPASKSDPLGLATPDDVAAALGAIHDFLPQVFITPPTSVTMVQDLTSFGIFQVSLDVPGQERVVVVSTARIRQRFEERTQAFWRLSALTLM